MVNLEEGLTAAAGNIIPELKRQAKKRWMTGEIWKMMNGRRKNIMRNSIGYNKLDHKIKRKCDQAQEEWLNKESVTILR